MLSKLLDKIGITDSWVQIALVGMIKQLFIFTLPGIIIGLVLGLIFR